jgi:hypothetical protein
MFVRLMLAICGGLLITGGILLTMTSISESLRAKNDDKYFLIDDILPGRNRGRGNRPAAAALPPERENATLTQGQPVIPVDGLRDPGIATAVEATALPPSIDELPRSDEAN